MQSFVGLIKDTLLWIPRNGKRIKIWLDNIFGQHLLGVVPNVEGTHVWMQESNLNLFDILEWTRLGAWKIWKILNPPLHLQHEYILFLSHLHGKSPIHLHEKDSRGWVRYGVYTVKEGYKILEDRAPRSSSNLWCKVWNTYCIPKINLFLLLEHNKLLIIVNLLKRGIEGPSQCVLCNSFVVHDSRLFLD